MGKKLTNSFLEYVEKNETITMKALIKALNSNRRRLSEIMNVLQGK